LDEKRLSAAAQFTRAGLKRCDQPLVSAFKREAKYMKQAFCWFILQGGDRQKAVLRRLFVIAQKKRCLDRWRKIF